MNSSFNRDVVTGSIGVGQTLKGFQQAFSGMKGQMM
jgi:hypothetical protein